MKLMVVVVVLVLVDCWPPLATLSKTSKTKIVHIQFIRVA